MIHRDEMAYWDNIAAKAASNEKHLKPPTQNQINNLYIKIYNFMEERIAAARAQGKSCLFVIGETHRTDLGKSSMLVEKMFMHAGKRLGIKNLIVENGPDELRQKLEFAPMLEKMKIENPEQYKIINNKMNVVNHIVKEKTLMEHYRGLPAEPTRGATPSEREKIIFHTAAQQIGSGLMFIGNKHLKGSAESTELNNKYLVVPVCAQSKKMLELTNERGTEHDKTLLQFANDPTKVKQFGISARFVTMDPDLLSNMIREADSVFTPTKDLIADSTVIMNSKFEESKTIELTDLLVASTQSPLSPLAIAETAEQSQTADPSFAERALVCTPVNIPGHLVCNFGMWVGSKFGWCANPFQSLVRVESSDTSLSEARVQLTSAKRQLESRGINFDNSLPYLFGKSYSQGTAAEQEKMRLFLVKIVNGDVSKEMGEQFNSLSNIRNDHQRAKSLNKLMLVHEEQLLQRKFYIL